MHTHPDCLLLMSKDEIAHFSKVGMLVELPTPDLLAGFREEMMAGYEQRVPTVTLATICRKWAAKLIEDDPATIIVNGRFFPSAKTVCAVVEIERAMVELRGRVVPPQ